MFQRRILTYLNEWKDKRGRKPLILRGARQAGKTSACLLFAEKQFKHLLHINLEKTEHLRLFREEISLNDFKQIVRVKFKQELVPGETLLFLDEIQDSPPLVKLLRFFYEEMPGLHVVCAGSLLEAVLEREGFSFPVGRVESAYVYPLDFFEFLEAKGEAELLGALRSASLERALPQALHEEAVRQFYEYAMIGGMPEVVERYLEKSSFQSLEAVYESLISGYAEDVPKYAGRAASKYLTFILEQAPLFAGTAITYEKFGGSRFRSREMADAFAALEKAMLLKQVKATKSTELPLVAQPKRAKKLLFLDVGLANHETGIQEEFLNLKELNDFYRGRIAEQVVGQNVIAQSAIAPLELLYWAREKPEGEAELDFCFSHRGRIMGIEVKSGPSNQLRSLLSFSRSVKNPILARIYGGALKQEKIAVGSEKTWVTSVPFYLVPRIPSLLD